MPRKKICSSKYACFCMIPLKINLFKSHYSENRHFHPTWTSLVSSFSSGFSSLGSWKRKQAGHMFLPPWSPANHPLPTSALTEPQRRVNSWSKLLHRFCSKKLHLSSHILLLSFFLYSLSPIFYSSPLPASLPFSIPPLSSSLLFFPKHWEFIMY